MERAAILHDAQPAGGDLVVDAVVQDDDAIGDVFLQALARQPRFATLRGDDGGDALVLEPAEEPAQLGAQDGFVGQAGEEGLDGVQHDALGVDRVNGLAQPDEQPFQVELAGFLDLAALDADIVHNDLLLEGQLGEVESERGDVLAQVGLVLLEGHEHAGLVEFRGAANQELHRK